MLSSLPKSIGLLTKLKILNIKENGLKSLPETIGQLTVLEELHLFIITQIITGFIRQLTSLKN